MSRRITSVELLDHEAIEEGDLAGWLDRAGASLVWSHTNKVMSCGLDDRGRVVTHQAPFDRVTGVAYGDDRLVVAAHHELWTLTDAIDAGERSPLGADRWFMCRTARFVGGVVPAEPLPVDGGDCWFVSVALSAVCSLDETLSARVRWVPPFISAVRPEHRCRLTGLGARDGAPAVVTSVSTSDEPGGWSAAVADGGVVVDLASGEIIAGGLSMPHSPRWHDGRWWLAQAGTGEIGYLDGDRFEAVARIDGFARGLVIHDGTIAVGGSGSRWDELVDGLPVGQRVRARGARPESGVFLVDLTSGERLGGLRLDGTAREIADVLVVPGARRVELASPRGAVAQEWTTYPVEPG